MDILSNMTIGYDAKRASRNATGLGNYSRKVIGLVAGALPSADIRLYVPHRPAGAALRHIAALPNVVIEYPSSAAARMAPGVWRSIKGLGGQVRRDGCGIYHGLSGELPPDIFAGGGVATVLTVHDVIFRRFPANYSAIDRRIYDAKLRYSLARASRIMAISECTARDIMDLYGVSRERIDVVYQGCDPTFGHPASPGDIERVKSRYGIGRRYILAVGTIEIRKNQELAVRALSQLPPDVDLLIAGGTHGPYKERLERLAAAHGVAGRMRFLGSVALSDLPALYSGASVVSYTSRYEGFGLPVIEAIGCGSPVIAATGSCLEEAGGPGALYVGPDDVRGYVEAALSLLEPGGSLSGRLVEEGRRYVGRFGDEAFTAGLLACYRRAAADRQA